MDHSRSHLAFQCASIALLSVSLWYFYKTRRRHLSEAAVRRELDLLHWQKELQGLKDADADVDEEESAPRCGAEKDSLLDVEGGDDKVSRKIVRGRCNKASGADCSRCTPNHTRTIAAVTQQIQHFENVTPVQNSDVGVESNLTEGKIFYASQTGNSKRLADKLLQRFVDENFTVDLLDPSTYEPEDLPSERLIIFVLSTWENGAAPDNASFLGRWIEESSSDFRMGSWLLRGCKYAIFGLGSKTYGSTYNLVARSWDRQMAELGAVRILRTGEGDQDDGTVDMAFETWTDELLRKLKPSSEPPLAALGEDPSPQREDIVSSEGSSDYYTDDDEEVNKENIRDGVIDLEDVVGRLEVSDMLNNLPKNGSRRQVFRKKSSNKESTERGPGNQGLSGDVKEMVTPTIRLNLEKQVNSYVPAVF